MTRSFFALIALITVSFQPLMADEASPHTHDHPAGSVSGPDIHVPADARDAVACVERFAVALSDGDLARAGAELDPNVLIFEGGDAERSAAEYLGGHAKADAAFLKTAQQTLLARVAGASGNLAWVASESELHVQKDGQPVTLLNTETMVLRQSRAGWRIVHIHWSSRKKTPAAAH